MNANPVLPRYSVAEEIANGITNGLGIIYSIAGLAVLTAFASVFGTPIAGAIFGVEVLFVGGLLYDVLLPSFVAGIVGYHVPRRARREAEV